MAALVLALAGCATPAGSPSSAPTVEPSPTATTGANVLPLTGTFVSQGAETTGTVSLEETAEGDLEITLSGFSTGPGTDRDSG